MSARSELVSARRWAQRGFGALHSAMVLRACDGVGRDVTVTGTPAIENGGKIEIGSGASLECRPVPVQLGTGACGSLLIRDHVHVGYGTSIYARGLIVIGEGCRIGASCLFDDTDRDAPDRWERLSRPIVVGRDVVVGNGVMVLPGSYIGDAAVIASGSVVSGVIPARSHAAGTPAEATEAWSKRGGGDIAERVLDVVSAVFDAPARVSMLQEPRRMSAWNAAGALRLVHALEREFDARLSDPDFLQATTVADLVAAVRRVLDGVERPNAPPPAPIPPHLH